LGKTKSGLFVPSRTTGAAYEAGQASRPGSVAADIINAFARWGSLSSQARRFWIDHAIVYSLTKPD
jgi:hypothetical protein